MKFLLDTDVVISLLRGNKKVAASIDRVGISSCRISEITRAELLYGVELSRRKGRKSDAIMVDRLLDTFEVVPVGGSLSLYASIKADLVCSGTPIEDFDLLIGCTALINSFVLVSGNIAHMSRIKGLSLENWI